MVLKLYGWRPSPYVQMVMVVLYEKHVPFEFINVELSKLENRRPEYAAVHPFSQVPAIDDDGFILYESRAICRYLEEKYSNEGTRLIPADLHKRALVEQAFWTEAYHFSMHAKPILFEYVVRSMMNGLEIDQTRVVKETKALLATVDFYEQLLSKQRYIAGDEFSLADIYHLPATIDLSERAKINIIEGRPNVERWIRDVMDRDSWRKVKEQRVSKL
ncbi:hypothetical protein AGABI2DRAFT_225513 [Agaricus bisporus var. bisporus H97]|uniref:hypothetical protein n=1 Tax=Agaricus bisporus var. bisporus (strain H97 / ATCC MYA-4626 / FGSC 10389) TaxID=936046 RepID=UPI00029F57F5|nr:hypothetical protein AGABI2DRAFT_225513 [Agaricus bisporus var. bisporus H97]EKV44325.1 hypothetical protein AGABI2DRAFT_225513 [Agaricus bisporus var. bisporus H97]